MGPPGSSHLRFVGVSCSLGRRLVVSQQHHGRSGVSPGPLLSAPPRPAREGGAWRLGEAPPAKPAAGGPEPPDFPTLQKNGPDSDSTHTPNERRVAQIYPRVCPHAIHEPRSPLSRLEQPISSFYCRPWPDFPTGAVAVSSNWSFSMTKRTLRLVNKMGTCPGTYLTIAPLVWEVGGV